MENAKLLYVDIYRPIFDEDGVTTIDIKHLKKWMYIQMLVCKMCGKAEGMA